MVKNPFYGIYGLLMLVVMSAAQWSGVSLGSRSTSPRLMVPRTVRENPGSLRPNYGGGSHSGFGGK
ncbi:MAG: hypothetical protein ABSC08_18300 [Bryobacteraceae bacterium]|jgi:hypothetical protein